MRPLRFLVACALTALAAAPARADNPSGPEVLAKVDQALNAFNDGTFESKLRIKTPDGSMREYGFITYQKVPDKRLVRFTSPGDVKGMGVLVENADTMYVFLPGFQKVRRMGTHIKNQTFMGSDFSFEDMSNLTFGKSYDAKFIAAEGDNWVIDCTQKPGLDREFPRIKMWIDKKAWQPTKMEYMDASGKVLKTEVRDGYKQDSPKHWNPGRVSIIDHRRNEHESEIVFITTKIDSGLSDDLFSVRSLVRGQ
jgi:outer membrane lipoprotein-sorting protein